jgi:orotate phosphoribosyltransferase-like protein
MSERQLDILLQKKALRVATRQTSRGECLYSLRMVRPIRIDLLETAAHELLKAVKWNRRHNHIVAIAQSGIPLATALALQLSTFTENVHLSVVDPRRPHAFLARDLAKHLKLVTLVDNSIKTGCTARKAIVLLARHGIRCQRFLVLNSDLAADMVSVFSHLPVIAAFHAADLTRKEGHR